MTYATSRIHEEIAYLAYYFHWRLEDVLDLEHHDRRRYVSEASALVRRSEESQ
ncbi:DUF6760 family protein [Pseudonocardia xinjiangensis]|uniref:DUF6760 family protein n=1 Tax=Pseudonocardia xinjiangensis TaxID=75289 RepID=UPI0028AEC645|nr:DUF6760 family protein [Pseudonocardia xinjiangensis]